jgi:hypothetical protein
MSDEDVRRLARELLRSGLDAEQVLSTVLEELKAAHGPGVIVSSKIVDFYRPTVTRTRFAVSIFAPGPIVPEQRPGDRACQNCGSQRGLVRFETRNGAILCTECAARE